MTRLCQLSFEHVYLSYVLTMVVFTTSWWVVNQPIVVDIFIYAFSCFRLVILPLLGLKPLSLHIVAYFYTTFGGVTLYGLCCYYCFIAFL